MVKDEIAKQDIDPVTSISTLSSFIRFDSKIIKNSITLVMENASVARYIYKIIKSIFNIIPKVTIRVQKRFKIKQIYILTIEDNVSFILTKLDIMKDNKIILPEEYLLSDDENIIAYLKGIFLSVGSISNPKTSGYHLEIVVSNKKEANYINKLLHYYNLDSKILQRSNRYMIYIKQAEMISDLLKRFNAINSMFYFEDIRIYRDHKNMVNRLNNVELANQEKTIKNGLKQLDDIAYLKQYDLLNLLDDKTKLIIKYREQYPESSYQELADIISLETDLKLTKSGLNHHFRKITTLIDKHKKNNQ